MQYRNLTKGQTVLYSSDRTSSRDFRLASCELAEVTGLDISHTYWAKGGFSGGGGSRHTDQGVRVRLLTNKMGKGSTEFVTVAAHLVAYEGDTRTEWDEAQVRIEARRAEKERHQRELLDLEARFEARGLGVTVRSRDASTAPTLAMDSLADVYRLLAWIENSPGPLAG